MRDSGVLEDTHELLHLWTHDCWSRSYLQLETRLELHQDFSDILHLIQ